MSAVSADRSLGARQSGIALMDFASAFFADLIEFAKSPDFKGEEASFAGPRSGILSLYKVRWQDDQGVPKWEALLSAFLPEGSNEAVPYPHFFQQLLLEAPARTSHLATELTVEQNARQMLDKCADAELASRCTVLRHPNDRVLLATAKLTK